MSQSSQYTYSVKIFNGKAYFSCLKKAYSLNKYNGLITDWTSHFQTWRYSEDATIMLGRFNNKVAVITDAENGIGGALAKGFACQGMRIVVVDPASTSYFTPRTLMANGDD